MQAPATHIAAAVAHNDRWLPWLSAELAALGLQVTPGTANFLLVHFDAAGAQTAPAADAALKAHGIIVRRVAGYGLPDALRITVGTECDNRAVVAALGAFMDRRAA